MAVQNGSEPFQTGESARLEKSGISGAKLLEAVLVAQQQLFANVSWVNVLESMYFGL